MYDDSVKRHRIPQSAGSSCEWPSRRGGNAMDAETAYRLEIAKIVVGSVIALIGGTIAFLQWRTSHNKLKLDLYDYRFQMFVSVKNVLTAILLNANPNRFDEVYSAFTVKTSGKCFLFPNSIAQYIDEFSNNALTYITAAKKMYAITSIKQRSIDFTTHDLEAIAENEKIVAELRRYFIHEIKNSESVFLEVLNFKKIK